MSIVKDREAAGAALSRRSLNRRSFLAASLAGGAVLTFDARIALAQATGAAGEPVLLTAFIRINADNSVTIGAKIPRSARA
jgi:isoquinoline 1-oxidoreductase beta subunit